MLKYRAILGMYVDHARGAKTELCRERAGDERHTIGKTGLEFLAEESTLGDKARRLSRLTPDDRKKLADQRIRAGSMEDVASSNVVIITAGLRRKPDESRLDLINRTVDLFLTLLDQVKAAGLKDNSYLLVVSNPVDVLTYLAVQRSGLPWQRVLGLGTQLDTARFRSYLARRLQVPPTQVQALILGEHGDSMVPIWSSATVAGLPLEHWPGFNAAVQKEVFDFLVFLKTKDAARDEGRENLLALAQTAWGPDWDTPAEDEAWRGEIRGLHE